MPGKESLREGEKYRAPAALPFVLVRFRRFLFFGLVFIEPDYFRTLPEACIF